MNNIKNESIFSDTDLTASDATLEVGLDNAEMGSIQIAYTITTGDVTFQLQLSDSLDSTGARVWTANGSGVNVTTSGSTLILLSRDQLGTQACRVLITMNSGQVDALDIRANLKGSS